MKLGTLKILDRFEVPNLDNPGENYLTRWRIIETPWCGLFLHRFDGPDSRPTLHDHPWSFVSIMLWGGYSECRLNLRDRTPRFRQVRFMNVMRRDDAHYIDSLHRTPTWSLLLIGKRRRTWGYLRDEGGGRWTWTEFDKDQHGAEFDVAMLARSGPHRAA